MENVKYLCIKLMDLLFRFKWFRMGGYFLNRELEIVDRFENGKDKIYLVVGLVDKIYVYVVD